MKDDIMIGERIRQIRESLFLTREQFSEQIDVSTSFLSQLERGEKSMSLKTLMVISIKTGTSCDYILFGDTPKTGYAYKINRLLANSTNDVAETVYEVVRPLVKRIS